VSTELLARWEKEPESNNEKSLRGQTSKFTDEQIAFVMDTWKAYSAARKKVKFKAFMKEMRKQWKTTDWLIPCPSRKTIEDMLVGNGLRKPTAPMPKVSHTAKVKTFFPNAQVLLDGKSRSFGMVYKNQTYRVTLEFVKDIASGTTTGAAVGQSESYELVKKALDEHIAQHDEPLSLLVDNGPANRPLTIDLDNTGKLVIRAHPYRPQTKGHIESEFGIFEKKVAQIEIKGRTDQEIVMSIVDVIARMYLRLRNQTPRCGTCPLTPAKLMHYKPSDLESEKAYQVLAAERAKKQELTEQALKISREKADLIDSIVKEHRLVGDRILLKKALRHVELAAIKEAEQHFYVASQRDTFDESKRKMAYFCKIALNIQQERDQAQKRKIAHRRYGLDEKARQLREKRAEELRRRAELERLKKRPHEVILEGFESYRKLPEDFRASSVFWQKPVDEAIRSIQNRRNKTRRQELIGQSRQLIIGEINAPLDLRYEFINKIENRMLDFGLNVAKSVTPI
jgi:hypothetical protein